MTTTFISRCAWILFSMALLFGLAHAAPAADGVGEAGNTPGYELYVSPAGRDDGDGTKARPFNTLEQARDAVRALRAQGQLPHGATVWLRGGTYERREPFRLTAEDAGAPTAPVTFRAVPGETARLVGGAQVTNFVKVTDPAILDRLAPAARSHVLQADLRALGITEYGKVVSPGGQPCMYRAASLRGAVADMTVFAFNGQPMTLARWPNTGFVKIQQVTGGQPAPIQGINGDKIGKFTYEGDRPARWVKETGAWLHGYWFWDWSDEYQPVQSIDTATRTIMLKPPYHMYGYRPGQRYYALNLLCELDTPGEWYLDRQTGLLYFWPPSPLKAGRAVFAVSPSVVELRQTAGITFHGVSFEAARGALVQITGGERCALVGCTLRDSGGYAVRIDGGSQHRVVGCDISDTGEGGIWMVGGDRKTLTPGGLLAENNVITRFSGIIRTYCPAILVHGVGNRVAHNLIYDAPHCGILYGGNDQLIEYNEIHDVCHETGDVGAIYTGGDYTQRGSIVRYNYIHHIKGPGLYGARGVYLDDGASGQTVEGNLFYKVTRAMVVGGGRDNRVLNNVFSDCVPALDIDARGLGWAYGMEGGIRGHMAEVEAQAPHWLARYPELRTLLDDKPMEPRGNRIERNIWTGGVWQEIEKTAVPFFQLDNNLVGPDPRFIDPRHGDFRLKPDSPAFALGFQPIPYEKIGPYAGDQRASWPVRR